MIELLKIPSFTEKTQVVFSWFWINAKSSIPYTFSENKKKEGAD